MKWGYEGLMKNELTDLNLVCSTTNATVTITGTQCIANLGFDDGVSIGGCAAILAGLGAFLIILGYIALSAVVNEGEHGIEPPKKAIEIAVEAPVPDKQ